MGGQAHLPRAGTGGGGGAAGWAYAVVSIGPGQRYRTSTVPAAPTVLSGTAVYSGTGQGRLHGGASPGPLGPPSLACATWSEDFDLAVGPIDGELLLVELFSTAGSGTGGAAGPGTGGAAGPAEDHFVGFARLPLGSLRDDGGVASQLESDSEGAGEGTGQAPGGRTCEARWGVAPLERVLALVDRSNNGVRTLDGQIACVRLIISQVTFA